MVHTDTRPSEPRNFLTQSKSIFPSLCHGADTRTALYFSLSAEEISFVVGISNYDKHKRFVTCLHCVDYTRAKFFSALASLGVSFNLQKRSRNKVQTKAVEEKSK